MTLAAKQIQNTLNNSGQTLTIKVVEGNAGYDPTTGTYTPDTTVNYSVIGKFSDFKQDITGLPTVEMGKRSVLIGWKDTSGNTLPEIKVGSTVSGVGDDVVVNDVRVVYLKGTLIAQVLTLEE
jgi:hypothetical protein